MKNMKKRVALALCLALLLPCLTLLSSCVTTDDGIYTITFSINGEKTKVEVARGEIPVCPEEKLSWETSEHYYKVTGWDKEIVPAERNATYTATVAEYGLTVYDVRFVLPGDRVVSVKVHEGELPTPPEGYETDLTKTDKVGAFSRWEPELVAPTAENTEGKKYMIYTPVYTYSTRYYSVTFDVRGTKHKVSVAANAVPACPVDPTEYGAGPDQFVGWDKTVVPAKEDATYTAWYGSAAEIFSVKDGAKGILTMTYDDGLYDTAVWVNQKNKQYGLNGSCMLVASKLNADSIRQWKTLFADGTLEPECHSMTHATLPADWSKHYQDQNKRANNNQTTYKYELVDSKAKLQEFFPGREIVCFAPGNNTLSTASFALDENGKADLSRPLNDGGAQAVADATYYAVRQGRYGIQSLDPAPNAEIGGWYNLQIQWFREWMNGNANGLTWLDETVGGGGWLIVMCHAIYGEGAGSSGSKDLTTADADRFFARAGSYVASGDLWCATFGEATRYLRERQSATAYRTMRNKVLYVGLKLDRTTTDGKPLEESVFNYPLTVKASVPSTWHTASYELNGKTVTTSVFTDPADGQKYVAVNVIPGADGAIVTTAVTMVD